MRLIIIFVLMFVGLILFESSQAADRIVVTHDGIDNGYISCAGYDHQGNLALAGTATYGNFIESQEAVVVQTNLPDGALFWKHQWLPAGVEHFKKLAIDGGDNVYLSGVTGYGSPDRMDVMLVKYSPGGKYLWGRGWNYYTYATNADMWLAADGKVLIAGSSIEKSTKDLTSIVLCYSTSGNLEWAKSIQTSTARINASSIAGSDAQMYIAIRARENEKESFGIVKADQEGEIQWVEAYRGGFRFRWECLAVDSAGNILVYGQAYELNGITPDYDLLFLKLNPAGEVIWRKFIATPYDVNHCKILVEDDDGLLLCGGIYEEDDTRLLPRGRGFIALKLAADGTVEFCEEFRSDKDASVVMDLIFTPAGIPELVSLDIFANDDGWQPMKYQLAVGELEPVELELSMVTLSGTEYEVPQRSLSPEELEELGAD